MGSLPTSLDAKYKAKAAIDTFLVRVGDLGSTALVGLGDGSLTSAGAKAMHEWMPRVSAQSLRDGGWTIATISRRVPRCFGPSRPAAASTVLV